jgi:rare lipoprotein A
MKRSSAPVRIALATIVLTLAACSGTPKKPTPPITTRVQSPSTTTTSQRTARTSPYAPAQEDPSKRGDYTRGGLYAPHIQDSAPDGLADVDLIPEPEVTNEPRSRYGNRSPALADAIGNADTSLSIALAGCGLPVATCTPAGKPVDGARMATAS